MTTLCNVYFIQEVCVENVLAGPWPVPAGGPDGQAVQVSPKSGPVPTWDALPPLAAVVWGTIQRWHL